MDLLELAKHRCTTREFILIPTRKEFDIPGYIKHSALLILHYPVKDFLNPECHKTERKQLENTVMYASHRKNGASYEI